MYKITLEDISTGKKLTLFIADDAFDGAALPEETQQSIQRLIAERLFAKVQGQQVISLTKINLPNAERTVLSFEFTNLADNSMIRRGNIQNPVPSDEADQIQIQDLSDQGVAYSLPPDTEQNQYRKILLEKQVCEEDELDYMVACLVDDPAIHLQSIKQEIFSDIPEDIPLNTLNDLNTFVDGVIYAKSELIKQKREELVVKVQKALHDSYAYYAAILPLASQLYSAAKAYYLEIWKLYGTDSAALRKERDAFNELFNGIAQIDEEFNLSSVEQTLGKLRSENAADLEKKIADLVHLAYTNNKLAFDHLNQNLATNDIYSITGSLIPWSYKFTFTDSTNALYNNYKYSISAIDDLPPIGYFRKELKETIDDARAEVRRRALHIKEDKKHEIKIYVDQQKAAEHKQQKNENIKRNKATIISLCVGAAIAVGAAVALAVTLGMSLGIGLIIAGTVVGIMGAATLIGRLIDKCKPAKKILENADRREQESLLNDYDAQFEDKPSSTLAPSKSVPFISSRSDRDRHGVFSQPHKTSTTGTLQPTKAPKYK